MILDTSALSAFADGDPRLQRIVEVGSELSLPVIVLGEYLFGTHQSRWRARYQQWLDANLALFDLLFVGLATARYYAEIRRELRTLGKPIPSNDLWIAALAREHRLPLVSLDQHFEAVPGLRVLSW